MTATIFDYFTTGANELGSYPIIENEFARGKENEDELERVQVRFSEYRFGILVRHTTRRHWCGYVAIAPIAWSVVEPLVRKVITPRVSYADYGNDVICWMIPNSTGALRERVQIVPTPDTRGDFWVGFSLRGQDVGVQEALAFLFSFEQSIHAFIK